MAMSKKDFIALADAIKQHAEESKRWLDVQPFTQSQLNTLAAFCKAQNLAFMRDRWLGYIAGENGKNGGSVK